MTQFSDFLGNVAKEKEQDAITQALLTAAREFADSIAFFDEDRGYVAYGLPATLKLRDALVKAAFDYGKAQAAKPTCDSHVPIQHRDGKPPWCRKCGLDANFIEPVSMFDRRNNV